MKRVTQPREGQRIHNSRRTGPYTRLEIGTVRLLTKTTVFSLGRDKTPGMRQKLTLERVIRALCKVPLKNFFLLNNLTFTNFLV
jgi:hypothetical protein